MPKEAVVIGGTYINAYSIFCGLSKIGWKGDVYFIKERRSQFSLIDLLPQKRIADVSRLQDIFPFFSGISQKYRRLYFMVTDEKFHEVIHNLIRDFPNIVFWGYSRNDPEIATDKVRFYEFLKDISMGKLIPDYISGSENPFDRFGDIFIFRMRKSWDKGKKLPRVKIIRGKREFENYLSFLQDKGFSKRDWCYQELLDIAPEHNVSVVGWHEPNGNHKYLVTRKVLSHPDPTGNGDVVELVENQNIIDSLTGITKKVLDSMDYIGPFELEFVFDKKSMTYKMIELNPRFWMQHLLFEMNTGFLLLHRYLSMSSNLSPVYTRYWINTFYSVFRLLKFNWKVLRYLLSSNSIHIPPVNIALRYALYYIFQKIQNRL